MVQFYNPIPPATATPSPLGTAAVGSSQRYAREDHVHPAPATPSGQQALRVATDGTGAYTWTYATPFAGGVVPIIECAVEGPTTTELANVYIVGTPTNTSATFQVTRLAAVTILGISVLGIQAPAARNIHLTARAP